jgi:hypothetical protein
MDLGINGLECMGWRACVYREGGVILFPLYVSASKLKFGEVYISNSIEFKIKN